MSGEEIIFEGRTPLRVIHLSHGALWLGLLGWNVGLLISWLQTFGQSIKITTQRIVMKRGVLSQDVEEVEFYRVKDTRYQQELLQRIFGIGTITILSDDATAPTLTLQIHNPEHYREQIRACVNKEKQRMGIIQVE